MHPAENEAVVLRLLKAPCRGDRHAASGAFAVRRLCGDEELGA